MAEKVSVDRFESKSHDEPDERRTPPHARIEQVTVAGHTIGRFTFEPGWRWSTDIKPIMGTDRCELSHLGFCVSGHLKVELKDGSTKDISAGHSYSIPPGHDAWVEGDKHFVGLELISSEQYAKKA